MCPNPISQASTLPVDLCGLASTFSVQLICKSCLVFAFCWAFSFSLVHVCRFGQLSMWMASVSTLHACKSGVFRSAYQTQMAVFFPPRTSSAIPCNSIVCPTWDYNLSEPCLLTPFYSASCQVSPFRQRQQALFPGSAVTLVELLPEKVQDGAAQAAHRLTRSFLNWVSGVSTSWFVVDIQFISRVLRWLFYSTVCPDL